MTQAAVQTFTAGSLQCLGCDEEGFLLDARHWHPGLIEPLAAEAELPLTEERCAIIHFIRDYYETKQSVPEAWVVLNTCANTGAVGRAPDATSTSCFRVGTGSRPERSQACVNRAS